MVLTLHRLLDSISKIQNTSNWVQSMSHQLSFLFDALRGVDTDQMITLTSRLYSSDTPVLKAVDTDQKIALSLTQL